MTMGRGKSRRMNARSACAAEKQFLSIPCDFIGGAGLIAGKNNVQARMWHWMISNRKK